MRYSTEIKKFLYSQYFFGGLRTAIGVSAPAVAAILLFHNPTIGFTIAIGAVATCVLDMPGPLKYKTNDMLACSLIGFVAALLTGVASADSLTLWLTVVPMTFVLSIIQVYGNKWQQISLAALLIMVLTLGEQYTVVDATTHALWILAGSIWYTCWSNSVSRWQWQRIERQAIAECMFAAASYLRARGDFYDLDIDLEDSYRLLVTRQIAAIDRQDAARDIVLRNLPQFRSGQLDTLQVGLFNLFINSVDLHDTIVATHTDYAQLRDTLGRSDIMLFMRDAVHKVAHDFEDVGLAVLEGRPSYPKVSVKAELRALEYEIELMRKHDAPVRQPEVYSAVVSTYRRIWSASRLTAKMHRNTRADEIKPETEMRVDHALNRFLVSRRFEVGLVFSNLSFASPIFRHALRVTLAVAVGLWIGKLLPITNSYWIVMTTVIILKPGFSLTRQRNTQRLIGTVLGCAATVALILTVKSPHLLLAAMFVCMLMSYSLVLFNYTASVVFTSSWVLLLLHLLAPGGIRIVGERAIDTFIGSALAVGASYLFPYWEYRVMSKLVQAMVASTRQYFEAACTLGAAAKIPPKDADLDSDYRYRLKRKNVHIAFANLGNAFERMMMEPKAQQRFVPELNELLVQSHVLASQITAAAPLVTALATPANETLLQPLQRAFAVVSDNLQQAEYAGRAAPVAGAAKPSPAADAAATSALLEQERALHHELEEMVVLAEHTAGTPADLVQELKQLVHQCKQMIAASWLIRRDTCKVRLPGA